MEIFVHSSFVDKIAWLGIREFLRIKKSSKNVENIESFTGGVGKKLCFEKKAFETWNANIERIYIFLS